MKILILWLCIAILIACAIMLLAALIGMLRDERKERRRQQNQHAYDLAHAQFNIVLDGDGVPIPLATNYSGLRAMSDEDLIRAANYTATHTTKN